MSPTYLTVVNPDPPNDSSVAPRVFIGVSGMVDANAARSRAMLDGGLTRNTNLAGAWWSCWVVCSCAGVDRWFSNAISLTFTPIYLLHRFARCT